MVTIILMLLDNNNYDEKDHDKKDKDDDYVSRLVPWKTTA